MSRVTVTMCDGCNKMLSDDKIAMTVFMNFMKPSKSAAHYCEKCSASIIKVMVYMVEQCKKDGGSGE